MAKKAKQLDVLCVGDVVTDAFIDLIEKHEHTQKREDGVTELAFELGTKIPYDHAEVIAGVGNAPNAAVSFSRLGLNAGMVSNVGDDDWGREIIAALKGNGVDTRFVHENAGKASNYHYVMWYAEERTIFIKHETYDYQWPKFRPADIPKWVYFSSISDNAMEYHDEISDWLDEHPDVKLAFQPGTFQMSEKLSERMLRLYRRAEVVVLNREEATEVFSANHEDIHDQLNKMHEAGIKIAMVTDGPNGAYVSDGNKRWSMPLYPDPSPPIERTGAGDAFASTFTAALMKGADVPSALLWAPINSMNVVQHVGAQEGLLTDDEIDYYLRNAPKDFHPTEM
ncbi:MAG: ribokinase [Candidatus Saccharimonadales bacterium]|jgi:ribokinase